MAVTFDKPLLHFVLCAAVLGVLAAGEANAGKKKPVVIRLEHGWHPSDAEPPAVLFFTEDPLGTPEFLREDKSASGETEGTWRRIYSLAEEVAALLFVVERQRANLELVSRLEQNKAEQLSLLPADAQHYAWSPQAGMCQAPDPELPLDALVEEIYSALAGITKQDPGYRSTLRVLEYAYATRTMLAEHLERFGPHAEPSVLGELQRSLDLIDARESPLLESYAAANERARKLGPRSEPGEQAFVEQYNAAVEAHLRANRVFEKQVASYRTCVAKRTDGCEFPEKDVSKTIRILEKIVRLETAHPALADVFYWLGHLQFLTGEEEQARLAWLNQVCANEYRYLPLRDQPDKKTETGFGERDEDGEFEDPYRDCKLLVDEAASNRQAWYRVGHYHSRNYTVHQVEHVLAALGHVALSSRGTAFDEKVMFALASHYHQANRYPEATAMLARTADQGGALRSEALQYLAVCLFYEDWDENSKPDQVSGLERLTDPELMPQDREWTSEVFDRLSQLYVDYHKFDEAIAVWELFLKNWPLDPLAPFVQDKIAASYWRSRRFDEAAAAHDQLEQYGPGSEWWQANDAHLELQIEAEEMIRAVRDDPQKWRKRRDSARVWGGLRLGEVTKILSRRSDRIDGCRELGLSWKPGQRGRVDLRFTIGVSGKVSAAEVVYNGLTAEVGACLVDVFGKLRFPPPEGGTVTFDFVVAP